MTKWGQGRARISQVLVYMAGYTMRSFSGSRGSRRSRIGDDCSFQYGNYHAAINIFLCFFLQRDVILRESRGGVSGTCVCHGHKCGARSALMQ